MQRIEMVNGTLRRCPRVGEDLEDVKVVSQGVGSYQQHSYKGHIVTDIRNQSVSWLHCKLILNVCCINGSYFITQLLECMPFVFLFVWAFLLMFKYCNTHGLKCISCYICIM